MRVRDDQLDPAQAAAKQAFEEGGPERLGLARADVQPLDGETVARRAMAIAADICVYTNGNLTVEVIGG